jgi:hypothetical protein
MNVYRRSSNDLALTRLAMMHASIETTQRYLSVSGEAVDKVIMSVGAEEMAEANGQRGAVSGT